MDRRLKVAQVIDSLGAGGAEKLIVTFGEVAADHGIDVTVISLADDARRSSPSYLNHLRELNVRLFSIPSVKLYHFHPLFNLIKVFWKERFDVIHTHLSHADILGGIAGWITGTPVVSTIHTPSARRIGHYRVREFVRYFLLRRVARRIIAVGSVVKLAYENILYPNKIDVVLNAVKIECPISPIDRSHLRENLMGREEGKMLLCIGRLVKGKGLEELLIAFSRAVLRDSNLFLVCVGDGNLKNELLRKASSLGLEKFVNFTGYRSDIPHLLQAADAYVSASYVEGTSLALLEAMAAGLPILATAVGEAPFLLADGRGILIQPADTSALEEGLLQIAGNNLLGPAALDFIKANCSTSRWIGKLKDIYYDVGK